MDEVRVEISIDEVHQGIVSSQKDNGGYELKLSRKILKEDLDLSIYRDIEVDLRHCELIGIRFDGNTCPSNKVRLFDCDVKSEISMINCFVDFRVTQSSLGEVTISGAQGKLKGHGNETQRENYVIKTLVLTNIIDSNLFEISLSWFTINKCKMSHLISDCAKVDVRKSVLKSVLFEGVMNSSILLEKINEVENIDFHMVNSIQNGNKIIFDDIRVKRELESGWINFFEVEVSNNLELLTSEEKGFDLGLS